MASISSLCSPSSAVRLRRSLPVTSSGYLRHIRPLRSVADLHHSSSSSSSSAPSADAPRPVVKDEKRSVEKNPIKLWHRYVDWLYQHKELGLLLDVSRIGFTDEFFDLMEPRLQKAFVAMQDLEKGSIANPDEGRMVGHYWLRNSKLAPTSFLRLQIENTLDSICKFADDIISAKFKPPSSPAGRFTQVLSVGIGGSALGPQFVAEALAPDNPPLKIRFIDNTDPAGIDHQIAQLGPELASTLVIVISKSGGTPETRNGLLEVQKAFREAGLDFSKQGVAITQENSLLDNTAKIEGWLARFPMFDWVGGRTSEMSAVGLLAAALQGIDIKEMLVGASLMDEATRSPVVKNNPAALLALCWYWASDGVGSKDMVVLPYKDSLLLFSRYLQQLVMESLGKEFDLNGNRVNQGLAVYGNKGSTDQHAVSRYIQQLREGVHKFFVTFIEVLHDRPRGHDWELEPVVTCGDYLFGMLQSTRSALFANDRESITVTVQEVTPRSVGALIALYECAIGIYAHLVNINAYHQPGVEAGKKVASEVLTLQKWILTILSEPRSYYHCTHKNHYGCKGKKKVQRLDDDPSTLEVTYCGTHTCRTSPTPITIPNELMPSAVSNSKNGENNMQTVAPETTSIQLHNWFNGDGSNRYMEQMQSGRDIDYSVAEFADVMFNSESNVIFTQSQGKLQVLDPFSMRKT